MTGCAGGDVRSRVVLSFSALYVGNAMEASGKAILVYVRAPKTASLGSWDMYSLALREGDAHGVAVYDSFDLEAVA